MNPGETYSHANRSMPMQHGLDFGTFANGDGLSPEPSHSEGVNAGFADVSAARAFTPSGAPRKIETAIAYMLDHLAEPLEMPAVSRWVGMAPSTFYHLFKRTTGYTPNDYFIRARMRRACQLLAASDLNVKEVASMLGYEDQFYFSRLFKSITGIPPRDYRFMTGRVKTPKSEMGMDSWSDVTVMNSFPTNEFRAFGMSEKNPSNS